MCPRLQRLRSTSTELAQYNNAAEQLVLQLSQALQSKGKDIAGVREDLDYVYTVIGWVTNWVTSGAARLGIKISWIIIIIIIPALLLLLRYNNYY